MAVAGGTRLGQYEVTGAIGAGGMGEVYRARDTRLGRDVAIKILPDVFAADPERLARFEREAKTLAALNHPHIAQIYGFEQAGSISALVMELVEGEDLADRMTRGPIPLDEALAIAKQIADALEAAHLQGIIHRDLKPANIKLRPDGTVKVLDFGLAKAAAPQSASDVANSPTVAVAATELGVIVGTAAYMAPEQARGKAVDKRADIWAFGCVLYEMLSGRPAFAGETVTDILAAVVGHEPGWAQLPSRTEAGVKRLLRRCLAKDPARRLRDIGDARLELEESLAPDAPTAAAVPRRRVWRGAVAAAAIAIAAAALTWWLAGYRSKPLRGPVLTRLTSTTGLTTQPALSPDGKLVAYASDRAGRGNLDIWLQQVAGGGAIQLTRHDADDHEPAFSPDGSRIVFRSERDGGGLYAVSALGGSEQIITRGARGASFSPDGKQLVYWVGSATTEALVAGTSRMYVSSAAGEHPRQLQPGFAVARSPIWTPDGTSILFAGRADGGAESADLWVVPAEGGQARQTGVSDVARNEIQFDSFLVGTKQWIGEHLVFAGRSGDAVNLYRLRMQPRSWRVAGALERLTSGAGFAVAPSVSGGSRELSRIVFAGLVQNVDIWTLPLDPATGNATGALERLTDDLASDTSADLSADGRTLAFLSDRTGQWDVWTKDLGSGKETALTSTAAQESQPRITADGTRVAFHLQGTKSPIYTVPALGGLSEQVCEDCGRVRGWSPDQTKILYVTTSGPLRALGFLDVKTGRKNDWLRHDAYNLYAPAWSPDGRWTAFFGTTGAGQTRIFIVPFDSPATPPAESTWIAVTDGAAEDGHPSWSPDGNRLYYFSNRDGFRCVWSQRLDPATKRPVGSAVDLHHFHTTRLAAIGLFSRTVHFSVSREKLALDLAELTGNLWMAEWSER